MHPTRYFRRALCAPLVAMALCAQALAEDPGPWKVYNESLRSAKYVDLTHTMKPDIPVWIGFGGSTVSPAATGADIECLAAEGEIFTNGKHGFEATNDAIHTDQLGSRLDLPTH